MTRTQIQLPDELYQRAKAFAAQRELSLAEVTRRGLELFLDRFPSTEPTRSAWQLPRVDAGGIKVPLDSLRDIAADDESNRSLTGR
jgi:hypothetical protein